MRRLARRIGAITPVRDRDVHSVPIPRMGGTAMLLGFGIAILTASRVPFFDGVFTADRAPYFVLLVGDCGRACSASPTTSGASTRSPSSPVSSWRPVCWSVRAAVVSLPVAGGVVFSPGSWSCCTVIAVVVTINAVNFVDGLDGLAAGIVGISAVAFFVYSYLLPATHDGRLLVASRPC